jgi:hypothetical protein
MLSNYLLIDIIHHIFSIYLSIDIDIPKLEKLENIKIATYKRIKKIKT